MMQSPQALLRDGDNPSPSAQHRFPTPRFYSTVAEQKLHRFNSLILVFRLASFAFSLAAFVFMLINTRASDSPHWYDFDTFRFVLAANAIVMIYSLLEVGMSVWEICTGATLLPEFLQVWFDFGHDQMFAYLLISASSAGTSLARALKEMDKCTASEAFCLQSGVAIALGYAAFLFLGLTSLLSGFRVVCFIINGSCFHM